IGAFEAPDDFAMLRKIPEDRMMEIHSLAVEPAKLIVRLIHLLRPHLRSSEYPIQTLEQVKLLFHLYHLFQITLRGTVAFGARRIKRPADGIEIASGRGSAAFRLQKRSIL